MDEGEDNMGYKVLIPTAGTGSRLGGMTKYINKSLVSVGNKPALSRIIESFPEDTEFVIPTGYKGELVKEFLHLAYPEKKIQFVDILLYEGEGSGLGLTVLKCKRFLQEPFIFCSCDTLVNEPIPAPDYNWMGYDHRDNREQYRTIHIGDNGQVASIDEKGVDTSEEAQPYIGLAGIFDYELFWNVMEQGGEEAIRTGEACGFRGLIKTGIKTEKFTWFDTGVKVELEATRKRFEETDAPNILEKSNEAIWFLDNRVIKFSDNTRFISDRVKRAKMLKGFVPEVTGSTTHMYCYDYVQGNVLSRCVSIPLFDKLLDFSKKFWIVDEIDGERKKEFKKQCMEFYKKKTYERVELFYKNFGRKDNALTINGNRYPLLLEMLESVDWDYISDGLPGQFHGDYHFENIVYDKDSGCFKLLDWRQNFGEFLDIGDIYYDLAKLNHGLIISHELIAKDLFNVKWKEEEIEFDFHRKQSLVECERYFYGWLEQNGYDVQKVKIMTALIFLNICALHEYPYVLLLYGLGKQMLWDNLKDRCKKEDLL